MALIKNSYNAPVMDAVDFLASETAAKKRQQRIYDQQKALRDKDAYYRALFFKAGNKRDDELWERSKNREDYLARQKALQSIAGDWMQPMSNRENAYKEYMGEYGIDVPLTENVMPLSPEAQKVFPGLVGKEAELGPRYVDLVNQRAAQIANDAARTAYWESRKSGGSGSGSGLFYSVPKDLLPYTGGKTTVDEATYRSVLDEYNRDRQNAPKAKADELFGQISDIRAENDALKQQKMMLQTSNGKYNKRLEKKNEPLIKQIDNQLQQNQRRIEKLQGMRNNIIFSGDSLALKNLMPEPNLETPTLPVDPSDAQSLLNLGLQYREQQNKKRK